MKDFTVLAPQRDPYRLDTPANHELGRWVADAYLKVNPNARRLHLRGLHYAFVGRVTLPNGLPYKNDDDTWQWFSTKAAKASRWLGYFPWDALRDARNAPPQIFTPVYDAPRWWLHVGGVSVSVPESFEPEFLLSGNLHRQPVRQVVIAEKQGVEDVLLAVCKRRQATLALPAGEISDTMVYQILKAADEDGRPLVIHQLGDFDPAGNQMAVSTGRTVQALLNTQFPDLDVTIHAPALTREQCEKWGLPSTPLKETEMRAGRWQEAMGWDQTELDAAVALAPDQFAKSVDQSLLQYFDTTLSHRGVRVREELEEIANQQLQDQLGEEVLDSIRTSAVDRIDQLQDLVKEINESLNIDPYEVGVEMPTEPELIIGDTACRTRPLFDSTEDWGEASRRLLARKRFELEPGIPINKRPGNGQGAF
ncbi:hypothetical protein ACFL07_01225 [Pseudomonadota bacterium]